MPFRGLIAIMTCVVAGGCLSEQAARTALRKDDPRHQTAVIARITREGKASMTGELIRLLDAEDEGVRFMAATSLHKLTGIDRGFHFAEGEKRKAIVAEWHRWYEAETGQPVPELEPEPPADEKAEKGEDKVDADVEDQATKPADDAEQPDPGTSPEKAKETAG